jgi:hypothetical protein
MKFKKDPHRKKKKKKFKAPEKKTRLLTHTLRLDESHFTPGTNVVELSLVLGDMPDSNYAIINGKKVEPSEYGISYMRPGKTPKQLVRFEHDGISANLDQYYKQYDLLIAVDTNTATIAGTTYHVGFCIQAVLCFNHKNIIDIQPLRKPNLVLVGEEAKPEYRNVQHLIQYLQTRDFSKYNTTFEKLRIGIITDCDLGAIPEINKRTQPLIDNFIIPENIQLIYASDAASDTLFNDLIKWCHKGANTMIDAARPELEKIVNEQYKELFL